MRWTEAELSKHLARRAAQSAPVAATARHRPRKPRAVRLEATEATIHEAVVGHLRIRGQRGVPWFHVPNGEMRDPVTAAKLKRMGVRPGVPDLLLLIGGRLHGLELKRERGGAVSPEQVAMHDELTAAGAIVATARGIDEALGLLEQWGALQPATRG
jgi:hypothetical protein